MRFKILAFIWFAALAAAPLTLSADEGCCDKPAASCCDKPATACCDQPDMACCKQADAKMSCCKDGTCDMPCCKNGACDMPCCQNKADEIGDTVEMLIAMDGEAVLPMKAETPTRQTALVLFQRPVWVGQTVLMGKYVIEHDTERQAKGEPCTHIYAFDDRTAPVAAFHCTHLEGERHEKAVVVLQPSADGTQRFVQFQFAGETAAHGYPAR